MYNNLITMQYTYTEKGEFIVQLIELKLIDVFNILQKKYFVNKFP